MTEADFVGEPGPREVAFEVAFVCTGNRYRSVLAEAIFRNATVGLPISVSSFGTLDIGPAPPLPEALASAQQLGLDISAHSARSLVDADLARTTLVVGFEARHAAAAIATAGARPEQTFVLLELEELLERVEEPNTSDPVRRALEMIDRASRLREVRASSSAGEIEDPVGRPGRKQQAIARQIHAAAARVADRLFGAQSLA